MSPADCPLRWRLPTGVQVFNGLVGALMCAVGLIFGIGAGLKWSIITSWVDQPGSASTNIAWGSAFILVAVVALGRLQRVVLELADGILIVQNMIRSYRIAVSEIVTVAAAPEGLYVEYMSAGRHRSIFATAAGGRNPWIFRRSRTNDIAAVINAQLSALKAPHPTAVVPPDGSAYRTPS